MTDLLLPPPPPPAPAEPKGDRRHPDLDRRRALAVLVLAGVAMDIVLRTGPATAGGFLALAVVAFGLLVAARAANRTAWLLVAAALAVAAWLPLRTSPWLIPVDVVVAVGLVTVAATYTRAGRLRDLTFVGGATACWPRPVGCGT